MKPELIRRFRSVHGREPAVIARAPGRIEFIGNHTDYNGGTVLGAAIDRGVWVGVAPRGDGVRRLASANIADVVETGVEPPRPLAGQAAWANYPLGMLAALAEAGVAMPAGFDFLAVSDLPSGAGLSSSAALELASGLAFARQAGSEPPREVLVRAARQAENAFVGVPCGILDQAVSGFGRRGHLVHIDCRGPAFSTVPLPTGVSFRVFNTHTRHALVDGLYAERHRECGEAARALGVACLADLTPADFAARAGGLPPISAKRARHVVEEIARVAACVAALRAGRVGEAGRLLTASHGSSRDLFGNSTPELDLLVSELSREEAVLGARLTGGGFGGAVLALVTEAFADEAADRVASAYAARFGARPDVLAVATADGASLEQS
jgi:galactokinase